MYNLTHDEIDFVAGGDDEPDIVVTAPYGAHDLQLAQAEYYIYGAYFAGAAGAAGLSGWGGAALGLGAFSYSESKDAIIDSLARAEHLNHATEEGMAMTGFYAD